MSAGTDIHLPPVSEPLRRDLALVLPRLHGTGSLSVEAYARGTPVALDAAIVRAAALIDASTTPVICGLSMLTIEAVRQAASLSRKMAGRLAPWPTSRTFGRQQAPTYSATLGHVFACDLVLAVGSTPGTTDHPIAAAIAQRVRQCVRVGTELDDVSNVQAQLRARGAAAWAEVARGPVRRVAVLLPPDSEPAVVRTWHELAAECQQQVRMCVFVLPDLAIVGNQRGALEVIAWQSGGLPTASGGTSGGDIAAADLLIEAGLAEVDLDRRDGARRICIGSRGDDAAELSFVTPGPAPGLAARVMRCDGIVLWLCDDPATAPPDPCVDLLERITARVAEPP